jgi:nicotinate-nucleotide pyrophosphorylase (carboxylating)
MVLKFDDPERAAAKPLVTVGLREDLGRAGDITSEAFIGPDERGAVQIVARQAGVIAGLPLVEQVFQALDPTVTIVPLVSDGSPCEAGSVVAELAGKVRILLAGERVALNFLTHLSGIASLTQQYVRSIAGTRARIYDTRKTLPGWRVLAKYAVRAGGGTNHRMGLFDAVLIKDNHLAAWKASGREHSIAAAVRAARQSAPSGTVIEVEVDTLEQLADALSAPPDIVLLDNMSCDQLRQAVTLRDAQAPQVQLEASGGVSLETVAAIAATGVERISIGALTHSAPILDLAFDWKPASADGG